MNNSIHGVQKFQEEVALKFQLYNGLFTSLPFHKIENTGVLLALFLKLCEDGFAARKSPVQIVENFFKNHTSFKTEKENRDLLFRFVQFAERQVVLFDALEDAAFSQVHDMAGSGSLRQLVSEINTDQQKRKFEQKLQDFSVRLVLTAHPTQFYPGAVLGIINDLSKAFIKDNTTQVNMYLQQLGKTAFFKKQKPTPYDEAVSLIWFLENVFYTAFGNIADQITAGFPDISGKRNELVKLGFWPGGDRDGNPFVDTATTLKVAAALHISILKCYYLDIRKLRRRLTFSGVETILQQLEKQLYDNVFLPEQPAYLSKEQILTTLQKIIKIIDEQHAGLFREMVSSLINKVRIFGLHFAALDIRQDSSVHKEIILQIAKDTKMPGKNYLTSTDNEKVEILVKAKPLPKNFGLKDPVQNDCMEVIKGIREIQLKNGEEGCHRYIISHATSVLSIMEVYGLFLMSGWAPAKINVDFVPLFETIDDLTNAAAIMQRVFEIPAYRQHIACRKNVQTIMVGFSDGTKDGGYLMANWSIFKAKEQLTKVCRAFDVEVIFFDGRGGPPARGGGKSHQFYASLGKEIGSKEVQITIQGQTISSNFGMPDAARFNTEQLINAGVKNEILNATVQTLQPADKQILQELADTSFDAYVVLKNDPMFLEYLSHASPLSVYSQTNISSRPAKRSASAKLTLADLRAIPFVGAWSQIKQNVTGYYGVGLALEKAESDGKLDQYQALFKNSLFFRTMIENCEMATLKCFFPLTAHLAKHPIYGIFWKNIHDEYLRTKKYLALLTGHDQLMEAYPVDRLSMAMRERIMLPLLTIQQYAIAKNVIAETEEQEIFGKLVMRCSFGIINAGRNSA